LTGFSASAASATSNNVAATANSGLYNSLPLEYGYGLGVGLGLGLESSSQQDLVLSGLSAPPAPPVASTATSLVLSPVAASSLLGAKNASSSSSSGLLDATILSDRSAAVGADGGDIWSGSSFLAQRDSPLPFVQLAPAPAPAVEQHQQQQQQHSYRLPDYMLQPSAEDSPTTATIGESYEDPFSLSLSSPSQQQEPSQLSLPPSQQQQEPSSGGSSRSSTLDAVSTTSSLAYNLPKDLPTASAGAGVVGTGSSSSSSSIRTAGTAASTTGLRSHAPPPPPPPGLQQYPSLAGVLPTPPPGLGSLPQRRSTSALDTSS